MLIGTLMTGFSPVGGGGLEVGIVGLLRELGISGLLVCGDTDGPVTGLGPGMVGACLTSGSDPLFCIC